MTAVSGSPTQLSTSVTNANELAGTPDDGFEEGDLAAVTSLWPNSTFRLRRTVPVFTPDNVSTIATKTGNGYWELAGISNQVILRSDPTSNKNQTLSLQVDLTLTDAAPVRLYSFTPIPSSTIRVYASVQEIKSDQTDDYGVDLVAAFAVDAAGVVTTRLASTAAAEVVALVAVVVQPAIASDGALIYLTVTGQAAETWRSSANLTIVQRSSAA